jgi:hypothetical protein
MVPILFVFDHPTYKMLLHNTWQMHVHLLPKENSVPFMKEGLYFVSVVIHGTLVGLGEAHEMK